MTVESAGQDQSQGATTSPPASAARGLVTAAPSDDAPPSLLKRALAVLSCFEYEDRDVPLTEISRRTGLPMATAYRIASELTKWGALERCEHGGYELGVFLYMLGEKVPRQRILRDLAMPYLEDLYEATRENANLGVLHNGEVLYLARVRGHESSDIILRVGQTLPAYSTSIGKVLLANSSPETVRAVLEAGMTRMTPYTVVMPGIFMRQMHEIQRKGYALSSEEAYRGVVSVAAPVFGPGQSVIAAISVTGRIGRVDPEKLAPAVRTAALSLSRRLVSDTGGIALT
jgi:DNA-binding IclR family transcriptional regulator